jgi:AcrR family transcriptional regulator
MNRGVPAKRTRRQPAQRRALETVDAVLEAVIRILKREGVAAVTTNHIAEVAGVSIGSVYQYFPDKHAIFEALHQRHIEQIDKVVMRVMVERAESSLSKLIRTMIDALVEAHRHDLELYDLLSSEVPQRAAGKQSFATRLHKVFLVAISARQKELGKHVDPNRAAFILAVLVDSLVHGAVLNRPDGLTLEDAREESLRAILAYLRD